MAKLETEDSVNAGKQTLHLREVTPRRPVVFWDGLVRRPGIRMEFRTSNGDLSEPPPGVAVISEFGRIYFACEEAVEDVPLRAD